MTRKEFLKEIKSEYQLVHLLSNKNNAQIYHFRHIASAKDIIIRFYETNLFAYNLLVEIKTENLPEIYDVIELEDGMVVLEEFIDGITLAQMMEIKKYNYRETKKILRCVCNALEVLHNRGIVHRDIKPENIMLDNNGRTVLIDFNASRIVSDASKDTVIMGTVGYVSPEQLGVAQSDARTDIYAMGILLNVVLTGKHPSEKLALGKARRIIRKCTHVNPDQRYKSALKLASAL